MSAAFELVLLCPFLVSDLSAFTLPSRHPSAAPPPRPPPKRKASPPRRLSAPAKPVRKRPASAGDASDKAAGASVVQPRLSLSRVPGTLPHLGTARRHIEHCSLTNTYPPTSLPQGRQRARQPAGRRGSPSERGCRSLGASHSPAAATSQARILQASSFNVCRVDCRSRLPTRLRLSKTLLSFRPHKPTLCHHLSPRLTQAPANTTRTRS